MSFRDQITFENALESSESILSDRIIWGSKSGNLVLYQGMFKNWNFLE